jgi:hypothetical protein
MEDVLEVYQTPHDPQRPLVCLDETSKQLIARRSLRSRDARRVITPSVGYSCFRRGCLPREDALIAPKPARSPTMRSTCG